MENKEQTIVEPIYIEDVLVKFLDDIGDKLLKAYGMEEINNVSLMKNIFLPLSKKPKEKDIDKKDSK